MNVSVSSLLNQSADCKNLLITCVIGNLDAAFWIFSRIARMNNLIISHINRYMSTVADDISGFRFLNASGYLLSNFSLTAGRMRKLLSKFLIN